jgi:hypothetical protein
MGACGGRSSSEIFRYGLELAHYGFRRSAGPVRSDIQTMIDVIVNQSPLGLADGLFDGVKLLGEVKAGPPLTEHFNHPTEMALGTLQPLDDIWVSFMNVILCHANIVSPWIGYRKGSLSLPLHAASAVERPEFQSVLSSHNQDVRPDRPEYVSEKVTDRWKQLSSFSTGSTRTR